MDNNMKKDRYPGLDGLRTIACIGIVMMHMASKTNNDYELGTLPALIIGSFTDFVYLFMAISAFGLCCGYYEKFLGRKKDLADGVTCGAKKAESDTTDSDGSVAVCQVNLADFYRKRYMKILPFFAFVVLIDVVVEFSSEVVAQAIADVSLTFGLFPNNIEVIGVGWFLGVIFAFYMIFPFFCTLVRSKRAAWLTFVAALVLNYITGTYFGQGRRNIVFSSCFFVAGALIYIYRDRLVKLKAYVTVPIVCAAILLYYCGYMYLSGSSDALNRLSESAAAGSGMGNAVRSVIYEVIEFIAKVLSINDNITGNLLVASSLIVFGMTHAGQKVLCSRFTHFISGISMEIYLCHMVIFRGIEKIGLNTRFGSGVAGYVITTVLVLAGSIVMAVLFNKVVRKLQVKKDGSSIQ